MKHCMSGKKRIIAAAESSRGNGMDICLIGDLCADLLLPYGNVKGHLKQLETGTVDYSEVVFQYGGTCGNSSAVLGKLGAHPYFVTDLCTDQIGRYLKQCMEEQGVDMSLAMETPGKSNMICIAVIDENNERIIFAWLPPGSDYPKFSAENLSRIPETEPLLVFTGGMVMNNDPDSMDAVCEKIERLKQAGSTIVFDLNARAENYGMNPERKAAFERMIQASDIVIGSGPEEFNAVTGEASMERSIQKMLKPGKTVIARDGKEPVIVACGDSRTAVPTESVQVLQTIGAGDTFNGAFLFGLNEGLNVEQAVLFANGIAAYMVSTPGHLAVPENVKERLEQARNSAVK